MFTTAWRAMENRPFQLGMAQIKISLDVKFSGKSVSHYSLSLAWEPVNLSLFYCRIFESSDSQLWLHLGSLENFKNVASGDLNLIGLVWVSCTGIFKSTTGGGSKPGCAFCAAESCSIRELRKKRHACMWINVQRGVLEWFLFFYEYRLAHTETGNKLFIISKVWLWPLLMNWDFNQRLPSDFSVNAWSLSFLCFQKWTLFKSQ